MKIDKEKIVFCEKSVYPVRILITAFCYSYTLTR